MDTLKNKTDTVYSDYPFWKWVLNLLAFSLGFIVSVYFIPYKYFDLFVGTDLYDDDRNFFLWILTACIIGGLVSYGSFLILKEKKK
jgi:hypothetical protein